MRYPLKIYFRLRVPGGRRIRSINVIAVISRAIPAGRKTLCPRAKARLRGNYVYTSIYYHARGCVIAASRRRMMRAELTGGIAWLRKEQEEAKKEKKKKRKKRNGLSFSRSTPLWIIAVLPVRIPSFLPPPSPLPVATQLPLLYLTFLHKHGETISSVAPHNAPVSTLKQYFLCPARGALFAHVTPFSLSSAGRRHHRRALNPPPPPSPLPPVANIYVVVLSADQNAAGYGARRVVCAFVCTTRCVLSEVDERDGRRGYRCRGGNRSRINSGPCSISPDNGSIYSKVRSFISSLIRVSIDVCLLCIRNTFIRFSWQ